MFPYVLDIPENIRATIPQLMELIETHKCQNVLKKEHGLTSMLLDFKTAQFRTAFIADLNLSLPMYTGLGRRLMETKAE